MNDKMLLDGPFKTTLPHIPLQSMCNLGTKFSHFDKVGMRVHVLKLSTYATFYKRYQLMMLYVESLNHHTAIVGQVTSSSLQFSNMLLIVLQPTYPSTPFLCVCAANSNFSVLPPGEHFSCQQRGLLSLYNQVTCQAFHWQSQCTTCQKFYRNCSLGIPVPQTGRQHNSSQLGVHKFMLILSKAFPETITRSA